MEEKTEILNPKVQYSGLFDIVAVGVVKQVEERITSPIIGNGTLMSGGIKLIGGALLHSNGGRLGKIASSALLVDAGEDLALAIMGMAGGIGGGSSTRQSNDGFSA